MAARQNVSIAGATIGIGLVLLGAVIAFDAATMRVPPTYAKVGPHIFPIVVAIGLVITGLLIAYSAFAPKTGPVLAAEDAPTDWRAVAIVSAGIILDALLLKTLGFIITALCLFLIVAFALGSRRYLRDIVTGVILATATYFGFTRGLGLQLPASSPGCSDRGRVLLTARRLRNGGNTDQPALVPGRRDARHSDRHPSRHWSGADYRPAIAGHGKA